MRLTGIERRLSDDERRAPGVDGLHDERGGEPAVGGGEDELEALHGRRHEEAPVSVLDVERVGEVARGHRADELHGAGDGLVIGGVDVDHDPRLLAAEEGASEPERRRLHDLHDILEACTSQR